MSRNNHGFYRRCSHVLLTIKLSTQIQAALTLICWSCVLMYSVRLAWSGPATGNEPMYWNNKKQFIILIKHRNVVNRGTTLNSEWLHTEHAPCKLGYMILVECISTQHSTTLSIGTVVECSFW